MATRDNVSNEHYLNHTPTHPGTTILEWFRSIRFVITRGLLLISSSPIKRRTTPFVLPLPSWSNSPADFYLYWIWVGSEDFLPATRSQMIMHEKLELSVFQNMMHIYDDLLSFPIVIHLNLAFYLSIVHMEFWISIARTKPFFKPAFERNDFHGNNFSRAGLIGRTRKRRNTVRFLLPTSTGGNDEKRGKSERRYIGMAFKCALPNSYFDAINSPLSVQITSEIELRRIFRF